MRFDPKFDDSTALVGPSDLKLDDMIAPMLSDPKIGGVAVLSGHPP